MRAEDFDRPCGDHFLVERGRLRYRFCPCRNAARLFRDASVSACSRPSVRCLDGQRLSLQCLGLAPSLLARIEARQVERALERGRVFLSKHACTALHQVEKERLSVAVAILNQSKFARSLTADTCRDDRDPVCAPRGHRPLPAAAAPRYTLRGWCRRAPIVVCRRACSSGSSLSLSIARTSVEISLAVIVRPRASLGSETLKRPTRKSAICCAVTASWLARSRSRATRPACTAISAANAQPARQPLSRGGDADAVPSHELAHRDSGARRPCRHGFVAEVAPDVERQSH